MNKAVKYVDEHHCCPTITGGTYGNTALWVAERKGNDAMVAYLQSVDCGMSLSALRSIFVFNYLHCNVTFHMLNINNIVLILQDLHYRI